MQNAEKGTSMDFIESLCEEYRKHNQIDPADYERYRVKRGLRNADGTGVMAGVTQIGNVLGYYLQDGERFPAPGKLIYRGIDVEELVDGFVRENRFGFEETAYLLLFGTLPTREQLATFQQMLSDNHTLPHMFTEDMIIKAPSPDVMNKLARSVLALYSYDDNPDDMSLSNQLRQAIQLIARVPIIVAHAFAVKRHYYNDESLYLHRPQPGLSVAENFLYSVRHDNQFTEQEARLLDLCLVLHAEHGGGNNSAFTCRVLSSSGTDFYSAIAAAVGSLKGPRHGGANKKVMEMFG
ncbi:citrate/2-methylcitrate synthase, partial [uncultured Flavonifractor sp.]